MKDFFEFLQALWGLVTGLFWIAIGVGAVFAIAALGVSVAMLGAEKGGL